MWEKTNLKRYVLHAKCDDTFGLVRDISGTLADMGASTVEIAQFSDPTTNGFFCRMEYRSGLPSVELPPVEVQREKFQGVAQKYDMQVDIFDMSIRPRILIAVSRFGHCLSDLLFRWKHEDLPAELVGVVSNHPTFREMTEFYGLPYHHLPVTKETKPQQEAKILEVMDDLGADLIVLARYMQILSDEMCQKIEGRAINIHHSFLPSFKGAAPYTQAYEKGVKISGATAHYVTSDLDEGPIIEQDVQRVEYNHDAEKMARLGRNIERTVFARAIYLHCQRRVLLNGNRTIVFK